MILTDQTSPDPTGAHRPGAAGTRREPGPAERGGDVFRLHSFVERDAAGIAEAAVQVEPAAAAVAAALEIRGLSAYYGTKQALADISMTVPRQAVTAVIGPSGCGKSTLLRCLNRMHEIAAGGRVEGEIWLDGVNFYAPGADVVQLRRRIGMVFQRPNPFPTLSIRDNVLAGYLLNGIRRPDFDAIVERSLRAAALWNEVKDKLRAPGAALSGGQQQRLCIARAIAVEPEVLLMDEPASALDPIASGHIEELIHSLKQQYTIVIVTHNMQQAARVSDMTAFLLAGDDRVGRLIEYAPTRTLFTRPRDPRTEAYITGRFG